MKTNTSFFLEKYGFPFANSYTFHLFNRQHGMVKVSPPGSRNQFGLCGGMCFAALDIHSVQKTNEELLSQWGKVILFLLRRQIESLNWHNLIRYVRYQFTDDESLFGISCLEFEKIKDQIRTNRPVPVGVMHARNFQPLTLNHQIVITGYEVDINKLILFAYDPNHPLVEAQLVVNYDLGTINQNTGETIRGLFLLKYKAMPIPWLNLFK